MGATTAGAPMPSSVGDVVLIVLDHVVGPAPGRPRAKESCKEPMLVWGLSLLHAVHVCFALTAAPGSAPYSSLGDANAKVKDPLVSLPAVPLSGTFPTSDHGHVSPSS